MAKENWGGEGLFNLLYHITISHQRKSGQDLKQGRDIEAEIDTDVMEE